MTSISRSRKSGKSLTRPLIYIFTPLSSTTHKGVCQQVPTLSSRGVEIGHREQTGEMAGACAVLCWRICTEPAGLRPLSLPCGASSVLPKRRQHSDLSFPPPSCHTGLQRGGERLWCLSGCSSKGGGLGVLCRPLEPRGVNIVGALSAKGLQG